VNAKKKPELASMREQLENMFVRLEEFIMTAKKELVQTAIDLSMDVRNADSSDASQEDLLQGPVSSEVCTARGLQRCQKVTSFEDIFQTDEDTSLEDAFQPEQFCQHGFPPILEEEVHFYERHLDEHSANHSSPEADGSASPCWLGRLAQHQALRYTCSKWRHLHWEVGELAKGGPAPFNSVHLMKRMVRATKAMVHINHKLAVQTMNFWSFLFASPILLTIEF